MADSSLTSPASRSPRRRAFTVIELLVGAGISGFVLAGVLSANLHLLRSSVRVTHYAEMDAQARRAFEQLAVDLKATSALTYHSATALSVTVEESDGTTAAVSYAWDSSSKIFYRVPGTNPTATTGRTTLARGISDFALYRFDTAGNAATTDRATKRLKVALTLTRSGSAGANATSTTANVYTLRNKPAP